MLLQSQIQSSVKCGHFTSTVEWKEVGVSLHSICAVADILCYTTSNIPHLFIKTLQAINVTRGLTVQFNSMSQVSKQKIG